MVLKGIAECLIPVYLSIYKCIYKPGFLRGNKYIASQKAWFTAYIAIIKKVEHML